MGFYFQTSLCFFALFLLILNITKNAQAAERIVFNAPTPSLNIPLDNNSAVAAVDLNEDGLDEYIAKTPADNGLFAFIIYGQTPSNSVKLGTFKSHNVMLGNDYRHGIRNLLVFKDAQNDFSYDVYSWSPQASRYIEDTLKGETRAQ